jgi:hypothetical protein
MHLDAADLPVSVVDLFRKVDLIVILHLSLVVCILVLFDHLPRMWQQLQVTILLEPHRGSTVLRRILNMQVQVAIILRLQHLIGILQCVLILYTQATILPYLLVATCMATTTIVVFSIAYLLFLVAILW